MGLSVTVAASPSKTVRERVCVVCGASLSAHRPHARHCSGACRAEASRIKAILAGKYTGPYVSLSSRFRALRDGFVRFSGATTPSRETARPQQLEFEGEGWL